MFTLTTTLPNESWCTSLLRKMRWNDCVICPRCQSYNIKKRMVTTGHTKSTFVNSVKDGSMTKQVLYFIIYIHH
ncbi:MAG: transposase [Deltaproteobacteria bacterium]